MTKQEYKILIADDSSFMRGVLKGILQANGYGNFSEAGDGVEAEAKILAEKPNLVLLDLIMPSKGGLDVLKDNKSGTTVTFVVISAVGQENIVKEAKSYGAKAYISKPFDSANVIETVNQVCGF